VNDNKSEVAGVVEAKPGLSSAGNGGSGAKPDGGSANGPRSASAKSNHVNGGAQTGKENAAAPDEPDDSLGAFLVMARESRGFSTDDVVRETRLPQHYLRMMETNDYSEISDQLYLVPFLRKYASFLDLDQEDVAMRFIREVQRSDSGPPPARLDQPLVTEPRRHRGWTGGILVLGVLVMIVGVYLYESGRHRQVSADTMMPHASASVGTGYDAGGFSSAPEAPH
jgi:Helix-turn-helix domain